MTEPVIEVGSDGDSETSAKLVRIADVQAVVNVDADPSRASLLAAAWKLPLVAIDDMESASPMGIWEFTSRPESVALDMGAGVDPCYRADPAGPLWAVGVAGVYEPPKDSTGYTPIVPTQLTALGTAQASPATVLMKGMTGFEENWAIYDRHQHEMPVAVVVTQPDSLADCVWFWNARAMRSHAHVDMPILLFPQEAPEHWLNFANDIRFAQIRSAVRALPDVILVSRSLSGKALHSAAARAGLVADGEDSDVRWGVRSAETEGALTYRVDRDFEPELFRWRWGSQSC
ncbi:hypothetical protein [Streptomyces sp. NPDC086989]|uniref:hypothetical protein n=1 Tax=Streptomyces sp. NPDC086989 TaxID=3365764 RepID=UPI0038115707